MQTFLTKASQKKVKLIHFLLEADNGYTMDEIQQYIGGSVKSISLYMKELSELFEQFNGKIVLQNENNQRFCIQKEE
ncbi:DNA-binding protein, partial [Enterococcus hirae]